MTASSSVDLAQQRAALERKIATLQRVITLAAVIWIAMLMVLGVFFFPMVIIRWGFVK
jgi:hypothetical protein